MSHVFSVQGPLVLIVEDEALIGLEVADTLLDQRYRAIGPFNSCAAALAWLDKNKPDAAILDVVLQDGPSTDIARELHRQGVPFLVYSGCRPRGADAAFAGAPWLEKPTLPTDLLSTLAGLTSEETRYGVLASRAQTPPEMQRSAA